MSDDTKKFMTGFKLVIMSYPDTTLVEAYGDAWSAIFLTECYSSKDMVSLFLMDKELRDRGYSITAEGPPIIVKIEE